MPKTSRPAGRKKPPGEPSLRYAAELAYVLTPGEMSAEVLCGRPQFAALSTAQLSEWIDAGDWQGLRESHFAGLRARLRRRMSHELVQGENRQREDMEALWEQGMVFLEDARMVPKQGWEGVTQTMLRIGEAIGRSRSRVMRDVLAEVQPGAGAPGDPPAGPPPPQLTQDEARAAARAVVLARQKKLREEPLPVEVPSGP